MSVDLFASGRELDGADLAVHLDGEDGVLVARREEVDVAEATVKGEEVAMRGDAEPLHRALVQFATRARDLQTKAS